MNDIFGVDRRRALSPLRGFAAWRNCFRGLAPTAKVLRRYAAGIAARFIDRYIGRMPMKPQFSLRLLFIATAAIAVLMAEAVVFPRRLAALFAFAMTSLLLTALGAGAIYARASKRSFCIGALLSWLTFPALTGSFPLAGPRPAFLGGDIGGIYVLWLLTFLGGFAAVVVRRLVIDDSSGERE